MRSIRLAPSPGRDEKGIGTWNSAIVDCLRIQGSTRSIVAKERTLRGKGKFLLRDQVRGLTGRWS